jgi:hypothetical protein
MGKNKGSERGGDILPWRAALGLLVFTLVPFNVWAGPQVLSEEQMERVYAQGLTVMDNISGSAVAAKGSSSIANPSDSAVQVGVGGSETNQNQIDMAGSTVHDRNQAVVNAGGDNKAQNNLNKAVQAKGTAQSNNNGVLVNAVQSAVVFATNAAPLNGANLTGSVEQHNVVSILTINF